MIVSENVIIGETIAHDASSILKSIRKGKKTKHVIWYGVSTAKEKENLLYIFSGTEYRLPFYHDSSLRLLGLAGSRKEALEMVTNLVKKAYESDAIINMKHFLEQF